MANSTKTNDLMNGPTADALQVDANFDEIHEFLNSQVLHTDGSRPMSNELQLSDGGVAASTSYVDNALAGLATTAGTLVVGYGNLTIGANSTTEQGSFNFGATFANTPIVFFQVQGSTKVQMAPTSIGQSSANYVATRPDADPFSSSVTFTFMAIGGM